MPEKAFTTYIITGGKSSRMGSDKASLLLNKHTFLKHIIEAVTPLDTPIKLVSSLTQHQELGYKTITDIEKDKGPVSAITSALNESTTDLNLLLSCDIPLLQHNLLDWLLKQHIDHYEATIVSSNTKKMPLIGVYNKCCVTVFKKHLGDNQLKLMRVLDDLKVNYIEVPEKWEQQVMNINTPKDLKSIQL